MKFLGRALILALGLPRAAAQNGEEACEDQDFDEDQCSEVGCCQWDGAECWSDVGTNTCDRLQDLQEAGDCAVPLTRKQCEEAAPALDAWWSPRDIDPEKPFAIHHIPGGCFAVKRDDGSVKKTRWNKHKPAGTGCSARRPCVCGPPCAPDAGLTARYGPQLCPSEIDARFEMMEDTFIQTEGLPHFNNPEYSSPLSDAFATGGLVEVDFYDVASVCITKCENDPGCDAVTVVEDLTPVEDTGKTNIKCLMTNSDLGTGAYLLPTCDVGCPKKKAAVFTKKAGKGVLPFENVQCNIDGTPEGIGKAFNCTSSLPIDGDCTDYLTLDWNAYMVPSIQCVAGVNGNFTEVQACFDCLFNEIMPMPEDFTVSDICRKNATDDTTLLRDTCATACLGNACAADLQTSLLCLLGSAKFGSITGPDFACPAVAPAPTPTPTHPLPP